MLQINQSPIPDFGDPLGLLVQCHGKIQLQIDMLAQATELFRSGNARSIARALQAIDHACRHFAVPGVKHTEDEEISLFPRLRRHGAAGDEALAAMSELESQHRTAEDLHHQFDEFVLTLPRDGSPDNRELDCLGEMAAELDSFYRPHILVENNLVFPIAARVLTPEEIKAVGAEMRDRRQGLLQHLMAPQSNSAAIRSD